MKTRQEPGAQAGVAMLTGQGVASRSGVQGEAGGRTGIGQGMASTGDPKEEKDPEGEKVEESSEYKTVRKTGKYPNGSFKNPPLCITGLGKSLYRGWAAGNWVWASKGYQHKTKVEYRICNGVFCCENKKCNRLVRPQTQGRPADQLKTDKFQKCAVSTCKSPLYHIPCTARIYFEESVDEDGNTWRHCKHEGFHEHPKPPGGRLDKNEEEQLDDLVRRNPTANPHALRMGNHAQQLPPLGEINLSLGSPQKAAYEVGKARERVGVAPANVGGKGAFSFFEAFREFQQSLDFDFIVDSSMHGGNIYIVMQSPWMAAQVRSAVRARQGDLSDPDSAREGFISDGDHTYFQKGVLLATVIFSPVLECWIPVLFTWILRQDTAHHRAHFRYLFAQVVAELKSCGRPLTPSDLINVVDFSVSQREAFILEYVEACISMTPGWAQLQPRSQDTERSAFRETAEGALRGCKVHFQRSGLRIKKQAHLVPIDRVQAFERFLFKSTTPDLSRADFDLLAQEIKVSFPRITTWLDWWLRPGIASMIFPACSHIEPALAARVPGTTNPVEHSHSLLHHAVGSDHDLLNGLMRLADFVNEPKLREQSILEGFSKAVVPKTPRKKPAGPRVFEPNDGRAPDTLKALGLTRADLSIPSLLKSDLLNVSYRWSDYSCFIDHTLEILFWGFAMSPEQDQAVMIQPINHHTLLCSIVYHFKRRIEILSPSSTFKLSHLQVHLNMMQHLIKHRIDDIWKLADEPKGNMGSGRDPTLWFVTTLAEALEKSPTPQVIAQFFRLQTTLHWECEHKHAAQVEQNYDHVVLPIVSDNVRRVCLYLKKERITIEDYFVHFVPRRQLGVVTREPLHAIGPQPCPQENCKSKSSLLQISHKWPNLLFVLPDHLGKCQPEMKDTFVIPSKDDRAERDLSSTENSVVYRLYARVIHQRSKKNDSRSNHFTAQLQLAPGKTFTYDDNSNGGKLIPSDDADLLLQPNSEVYLYAFVRQSATSMTIQTTTVLKGLHEVAPEVERPPRPIDLNNTGKDLGAGLFTRPAQKHATKESDVLGQRAVTTDAGTDVQQDIIKALEDGRPKPLRSRRARRVLAADFTSSESEDDRSLPLLGCSDGAQVYYMGEYLDCADDEDNAGCQLRKECSRMGGDIVQNKDETISSVPLSDEVSTPCSMCSTLFHDYCVMTALEAGGVDKAQLAMIEAGVEEESSVICCNSCVDNYWEKACVGLFVMLQQGTWKRFYAAEILSCSGGVVKLAWFEYNKYLAPDKPPKSRKFIMAQRDCHSALARSWSVYETTTSSAITYPIWLHFDAREQHGYKNTLLRTELEEAVPAICDILTGMFPHPVVRIYNAYLKCRLAHAQALANAEGKPLRFRAMQDIVAEFTEGFFIPILPGDHSLLGHYQDQIYKRIQSDGQALAIDAPRRELEVEGIMVVSHVLLSVVVARQYYLQDGTQDNQLFALAYLPGHFDHLIPDFLNDPNIQAARRGFFQRHLTSHEKAFFAGADPAGAARMMKTLTYRDVYPVQAFSYDGSPVKKFSPRLIYDHSLQHPGHHEILHTISSGSDDQPYQFAPSRGKPIRGLGKTHSFPPSPTPPQKTISPVKKVTLVLPANPDHKMGEGATKKAKSKKLKRPLEQGQGDDGSATMGENDGKTRRSKRLKSLSEKGVKGEGGQH